MVQRVLVFPHGRLNSSRYARQSGLRGRQPTWRDILLRFCSKCAVFVMHTCRGRNADGRPRVASYLPAVVRRRSGEVDCSGRFPTAYQPDMLKASCLSSACRSVLQRPPAWTSTLGVEYSNPQGMKLTLAPDNSCMSCTIAVLYALKLAAAYFKASLYYMTEDCLC